MQCPNCGYSNSEKGKFCIRCGTDFSKYKNDQTQFRSEQTSEKREKRGQRAHRVPKCIPFAAIVFTAFVAIILGRELLFPERGYSDYYYAAQAFEDALQEMCDENFSDTSVSEYKKAVADALPQGVKSGDVNVGSDPLANGSEELKALLGSVSKDDDSGLYVYVIASEGKSLKPEALNEINDEMHACGIESDAEEGYGVEVKAKVEAYEDTSLLKRDEQKSETLDDVGISLIKVGDRWYLWPSQKRWVNFNLKRSN